MQQGQWDGDRPVANPQRKSSGRGLVADILGRDQVAFHVQYFQWQPFKPKTLVVPFPRHLSGEPTRVYSQTGIERIPAVRSARAGAPTFLLYGPCGAWRCAATFFIYIRDYGLHRYLGCWRLCKGRRDIVSFHLHRLAFSSKPNCTSLPWEQSVTKSP